MSYILDALNKSEQERARKRSPDLSSLRKSTPGESFGLRHFIAILAALVLLNGVGIWYLFSDRLALRTTDAANTGIVTPPPSPMVAPPPTVVLPEPVATSRTPVSIAELPGTVRTRLPAVEITAHIYAEDADLRTVKINGISRKEGEQIEASLRLVSITETGVVLDFEGYAYNLDIIENWQLY